MKKLISKITHVEEVIEMGLLLQEEARFEIRELYLTILDKYAEGSQEFESLCAQLVEVQNLAFDLYKIEEWY